MDKKSRKPENSQPPIIREFELDPSWIKALADPKTTVGYFFNKFTSKELDTLARIWCETGIEIKPEAPQE